MSEKEVVVNLVNEPDIEGIKLLVKKVKNLFTNMNINKAVKNLDSNKILKILSEITKLCYEVKIIAHEIDRKSTRLNSSHSQQSRMPSSA